MSEDFKKLQKQLINDFLVLGILSLISAIYYLVTKSSFFNIIYTILLFVGFYYAKKGNNIAGKIGVITGILLLLTIINLDIIDFILGIFILNRSIKYNKHFPNNKKNDKYFYLILIILSAIYICLFLISYNKKQTYSGIKDENKIEDSSTKTNDLNSFEKCILDEYNKSNSKKLQNYSDLTNDELSTIKILDCSNKQITKVDLSKLINLEKLDLTYNNISSIDVSKNTLLKELWLEDNNLTEINLNNNVNLEKISLSRNNISNISFNSNTVLKEIWITNTNISQIDLTNLTNLEELYIYNNFISNIDLSNNINLKVLLIGNNPISNIDTSHNSLLEELQIEQTDIASIDISNNIKLNYINANKNINIIGQKNDRELKIEYNH